MIVNPLRQCPEYRLSTHLRRPTCACPASQAILGGTALLGLSLLGLDVRPLLALGSVGSLVVGLAAQATLSNFVSAAALYASRPFVVGDRVQLKSLGGTTVVEGVVEQILPMRTVIRTDSKAPVFINNKVRVAVAGMCCQCTTRPAGSCRGVGHQQVPAAASTRLLPATLIARRRTWRG